MDSWKRWQQNTGSKFGPEEEKTGSVFPVTQKKCWSHIFFTQIDKKRWCFLTKQRQCYGLQDCRCPTFTWSWRPKDFSETFSFSRDAGRTLWFSMQVWKCNCPLCPSIIIITPSAASSFLRRRPSSRHSTQALGQQVDHCQPPNASAAPSICEFSQFIHPSIHPSHLHHVLYQNPPQRP